MKYGEMTLRKGLLVWYNNEKEWIPSCFERAVKIDLDRGEFTVKAFDTPSKNRTEIRMVNKGNSRVSVVVPRLSHRSCGHTRCYMNCSECPANEPAGWFTREMLDELNIIPEIGAHFYIEIWQ